MASRGSLPVNLDLELLARFTDVSGPSGEEDDVAAALGDAFRASGASVFRDGAGNLHAVLAPLGDAEASIAVVAHLDEVGIVVRHVRADGLLLIDRIGGIGRRSLAARHVRIRGDRGIVDGVVGVLSHHLTSPADYQSVPPIEELYVDVGASTAQDVKSMGIRVGSRATFAGGLLRLGADTLCSKAMDDRALCYAMVHVARALAGEAERPRVEFVATVREEFDLAGAEHLARILDTQLTLVLDVTPAVDTPDTKGDGVLLGRGPALKLQDFHGRGPIAGYIASREIVELVRRCAEHCGVSLQDEVSTGLITDAARLAPTLGLSRVACLSLPTRYTHSPVECIRGTDLDGLVRLLGTVIQDAGRSHPQGHAA
jgi:putative aminopeptidase FrvX